MATTRNRAKRGSSSCSQAVDTGIAPKQARASPPTSHGEGKMSPAMSTRRKRSSPQPQASDRPRRRGRGPEAALQSLAETIVQGESSVVVITGAGLSVPSGIRPFRRRNSHVHVLQEGIWNDVIWTTATREAFRRDPAAWWKDFWNVYFDSSKTYHPNDGHLALDRLLEEYPNVRQITQNIDGLQKSHERMVEAHGRLGYYKCCPDFDSDDDLSDDDGDSHTSDRPAHLGHRRKTRIGEKTKHLRCPFQYDKTIKQSQLADTDDPKCPHCGNNAMPQALLFDEGYHSHSFYQFQTMEEWLAEADVIVFCGTSFAVQLTQVALDVARQKQLPVYNFNLHDTLETTPRLSVANILGSAEMQLPMLLSACNHLKHTMDNEAK